MDEKDMKIEKDHRKAEVWREWRTTLLLTLLILGSVLLLAGGILLARRSILSARAVRAYQAEKEETAARAWTSMLSADFPAAYLPWYNLGNILYGQGRYFDAMGYYYEALNHPISTRRECPVRINLALSILYQIDYEHLDSEAELSSAIENLKTARAILIEDGCAHEFDENGHDAQAQRLKDEIDRLLELYEQMQDSADDSGQDDSEDPGEDSSSEENDGGVSDSRENEIRERMEQQREDALEERSDEQGSIERYYFEGDGEGDAGASGEKYW